MAGSDEYVSTNEHEKLLDRIVRLERRMTALESRVPPPRDQTRMRNPNRERSTDLGGTDD